MAEEQKLRRVGVPEPLSSFEEARKELVRWEKEYPDMLYIALVAYTPDGFEYTITGERTVSEAVGLFYRAAHLAAE